MDMDVQQCLQAPSPQVVTGSASVAASGVRQRDLLHIKELEDADLDIGPTVFQHMDSYYRTNQTDIKQEHTIDNEDNKEAMCKDDGDQVVCSQVKVEFVEKSQKDMDMQRCLQATSSTLVTGSASVAASSVSQGDLLHIKEEPEDPDVDIGPTVFQHIDSYYRANQLQSNSLNVCSKVTEIPPGSTRAEMSRPKELLIAPSNIPGNKTTLCNYCGQKTTEDDYDERHLKSCLGQQKDLQQHQLRTMNSDTFNCNTCNRSFHKPHLLSAHQKLHQPNSSKRSVMIGSSDAGPSSQDESAKAKLKPFECDVCEKGYFSKAGLIFHKRSHSGIGLCVCYICDAKFPTKSRLINHLRTHTGEKPYHCGNCSARYAQSGDLTTHMRVHTGEKPYDCNTCGAKFARRDVLTRHMKIHTGEKPFECRECGAKFAQSNNFNNHMKNRHSKKGQN